MSKIYEFAPQGYGVGVAYVQVPDGVSTDLGFVRNTACDRINSLGVSEQMDVNVPRYDYRADYVAPVDSSYYNFDGVSNRIDLKNPTTSAVTNDFSIIIRFKTGGDIASEQCLYSNSLDGNNRAAISIKSGEFSFSTFDGATSDNIGYMITKNTEYTIAVTKPNTNTGLKYIYVNGVLVTTTVGFQTSFSSVLGQRVGSITNNTVFLNGDVYTCETYNIELTGAQVLNRYNGLDVAGNTLGLSIGKTVGFWYDLNHDSISSVMGAILTNSNNFGNNIHSIETCPVLLIEPSFTNHFKTSRIPITQTVVGLSVGVIYAINCKGVGIITIDETGGAGAGGTATEVNVFTYTATQTSVVVTLLAGHSFDWVQITDTEVGRNHVETLLVSVTKAIDDASVTTPIGVVEIIETIGGVEQVPITVIPVTYTVSEGLINSVLMNS